MKLCGFSRRQCDLQASILDHMAATVKLQEKGLKGRTGGKDDKEDDEDDKEKKKQAGIWRFLGAATARTVGVMKAMAVGVAGVLTPLALFHQVLNQPSSGFGVFMQSVKLVATVVAGALLPAFVAATGLMYAFAMAMSDGMAVMDKVWETTFPGLITVTDVLIERFAQLGRIMERAGLSGSGFLSGGFLPYFGDKDKGKQRANDAMGGFGTVLDWIERHTKVPATSKPGTLKDPAQRKSMDELTKVGRQMAIVALKQQLLGSPQYTTGENYYKQAQLAAIGANPFERKMLETALKQLERLEKIEAKTGPAVGR